MFIGMRRACLLRPLVSKTKTFRAVYERCLYNCIEIGHQLPLRLVSTTLVLSSAGTMARWSSTSAMYTRALVVLANCIVSCSAIEVGMDWASGTSLFSLMPDREFAHFSVLLAFGSTFIAGLGSEVVVGRYIVQHLSLEAAAKLWLYAQVVFPICMVIAVYSQSPFGLPFAIMSLWKFGFPETLVYALKAYEATRWDLGWWGNSSTALGLLLHHGSSAYFISCGCLRYNILDRYAVSMMAPLVLQHWFVLIRYFHFRTYCLLVFALEVLWEYEVFTQARFLKDNFKIAIIFLVLAHWLFLAGFVFEQAHYFFEETTRGNDEAEKGTKTLDQSRDSHGEVPRRRQSQAQLVVDKLKYVYGDDIIEDNRLASLPESLPPSYSQPTHPTKPSKRGKNRSVFTELTPVSKARGRQSIFAWKQILDTSTI